MEFRSQEAKGLSGVVAASAKGGAEADKGPHQEALAALAATRAAAENLRVRCGYCEACITTQGSARRCLVNRAAAAAAAGHSGAQVRIGSRHQLQQLQRKKQTSSSMPLTCT